MRRKRYINKAAGELAVRRMSEKARHGYDVWGDSLVVFECMGLDGETLYGYKSVDGTTYDLTFEQMEAELESFADAIDEAMDEEDEDF